jgi:hypothetical protein
LSHAVTPAALRAECISYRCCHGFDADDQPQVPNIFKGTASGHERKSESMSFSLASGVLVLTIDAELDPLRRGFDQQDSLEAITAEMLKLLTRHQMPATWAVADPAISAATERIVADNVGHEIAVLGDQAWVGHAAGRGRFGKELNRRVTHGRAAGLSIESLVVRDAKVEHTDLVVKLGLTSVATPNLTQAGWFGFRETLQEPQQLRFGLFDLPASGTLSGQRGWFGSAAVRSTTRMLTLAAAKRQPLVIRVSALDLVLHGRGIKPLQTLLEHTAVLKATGRLQVKTQAQLASSLGGQRAIAPAQSILRPAA